MDNERDKWEQSCEVITIKHYWLTRNKKTYTHALCNYTHALWQIITRLFVGSVIKMIHSITSVWNARYYMEFHRNSEDTRQQHTHTHARTRCRCTSTSSSKNPFPTRRLCLCLCLCVLVCACVGWHPIKGISNEHTNSTLANARAIVRTCVRVCLRVFSDNNTGDPGKHTYAHTSVSSVRMFDYTFAHSFRRKRRYCALQ